MRKSQTSVEGIFVVSSIFIMFLFILGYGFERRIDEKRAEGFVLERNECIKFSDLINGAFINGNGTEIISKINYNITTIPNSKLVFVKDKQEIFCTVPISLFSPVSLKIGNVKLKNIGDFVNITNV